jgi:hypothetical protein
MVTDLPYATMGSPNRLRLLLILLAVSSLLTSLLVVLWILKARG